MRMAQEAGLREMGAAQEAAARGPLPALAGFLKYLEESGLMEFRVVSRRPGGRADYGAMDNRIRMHALVLLANRLGLGLPYECDYYNYGPRSGRLAEDSRALEEGRAGLYDCAPAAVPGTLRKAEFERLVRGRDSRWLAAASTMTRLGACRDTRDDLMDTVRDDDLPGNPKYPAEYVSDILDELEGAGLVTAYE